MPANKIADFRNQLGTEFMIGNRRMKGYCIAVFADAIKVLPEGQKLPAVPISSASSIPRACSLASCRSQSTSEATQTF